MKLYVGNLSYSTGESDLRDLFAAYGDVESVAVITDRDSGRSKASASSSSATTPRGNAAIAALNGKEVGGRALTVSQARPKTEGGGGRPRSGRRRRRWTQPVLRASVAAAGGRESLMSLDWKIRIQPAEKKPFEFKATLLLRAPPTRARST
jgi:RNA recognition motif-containing protein